MKKNLCWFLCGLFVFMFSGACFGQLQVITTIAGNGDPGYSGNGGPSTAALLYNPASVGTDAMGNIYIADYANHVVRKIDTSGIISAFAGNGTAGYGGDNGPATAAMLIGPTGIAVDTSGNVFIADANSSVIRKVSKAGIITTYAGTGFGGYSGDNGPATAAQIRFAYGVAADTSGNVYIADYGNSVIRKINAAGTISTYAGTGEVAGYSGDGSAATAALLNSPTDVIADNNGNLFIADNGNHVVRKINALGTITTYAGNGVSGYSGNGTPATSAELSNPYGVAVDTAGNVYVADQNNNLIRKINTSGIISNFAGTGSFGYSGDGGLATNANLASPTDVAVDRSGHTYIADFNSNTVRMLTPDNPPVFINGALQSMAVCQDTTTLNIDSLLSIIDIDSGQTETWTVFLAPGNGALGGFSSSMLSTGDTLTPTGLTYMPAAGFSGTDSFKIRVSDGVAFTTATMIVTVNPTPNIFGDFNQVNCNGTSSASEIFSGTVPGTLFNWTNTDTAIGLPANGSGNIPSFIAMDTTNAPVMASITVTPSANGCTGLSQTFTISVNPTPNVVDPPNQGLCTGDFSDTVFFTGGVSGTVYSWTNSDTAIGLAASGVGNIPSFIVTNSSIAPIMGTIIVTPSANGCTGATQSLTITVNPTPDVSGVFNQVLCNGTFSAPENFSGAVAGTLFNWTNTDTAIGLPANSIGNVPTFMTIDTTNAPVMASITVTPSANGCTGLSQTFTISVNPTPNVVDPPNQGLCTGNFSDTVFFTGKVSGTEYSWTNSDTAIGLAASGVGNIPSFIVVNTSTVPIIGIITVTPSANGCTGATQSLTITVNPTPDVSGVFNQVLCNGTFSAPENFSGTVPGTSFNWTNTDTATGLAANGSGNIPSFMAMDTTNAPVMASITVTPSANGCTGIPQNFTISVNPTPNVVDPPNQGLCSGNFSDTVFFTGGVSGTVYIWTNSNTAIGLVASGVGNIPSFIVTNSSAAPIMGIITVTPSANGCTGAAQSMAITVNPTPGVSGVFNQVLCNGTFSAPEIFSGAVAGTLFNWTNTDTTTGLAANGSGNIPSFMAMDTTNAPVMASITVTPSANGCTGFSQAFTVSVNPTPVLSSVLTASVCGSALFSYIPTSPTADATFAWSRAMVAGISNPAASNTGNINETLIDTTAGQVVVTYVDTVKANGCSNTENILVTVNPLPMLSSVVNPPAVCDSTLFLYVPLSGTTGTSFVWSRAFIDGIADSALSGVDTIREYLDNTTADPIAVTYVYTLTAFGCSNNENVTVIVNPTPVLNPFLSPAICDSTLFTYATASFTPGTTFAWSRAAVAGISNPAASDTGEIMETLINTTSNPVAVTYIDTLRANGCMNIEDIIVTVDPLPLLTGTLTPAAICDSATFSYTPASATTGTTFTWTRASVTGIANQAGSGTGPISEMLYDTTAYPATVIYAITASANSCTNTQNVMVTVNPAPMLSSPLTAPAICNQTEFSYAPMSLTPGTTFTWTRAQVNGIAPLTASGSDSINEVLTNSTLIPVTVVYAYILTAYGCSETEDVMLTINPVAPVPAITTAPISPVCNDVYFQNFGAATPPPVGVEYSWTADNASISDTGNTNQYILVNFKSPGQAVIMLTAKTIRTGCMSMVADTLYVGDTVADVPSEVVYFNNSFICLQNNETAYQWGYDNDSTLAPTILQGEINQDYVNNNPDLVNNNYWVKVTDRGCVQKTYYNKPVGATMRTAMTEVSVYPNPAQDNINVEIKTTVSGGNIQVELLNTLGQMLYSATVYNNSAQINVAGLPGGLYLVNCYRDGIKISTTRIIKN